jgi:hypothetical protein
MNPVRLRRAILAASRLAQHSLVKSSPVGEVSQRHTTLVATNVISFPTQNFFHFQTRLKKIEIYDFYENRKIFSLFLASFFMLIYISHAVVIIKLSPLYVNFNFHIHQIAHICAELIYTIHNRPFHFFFHSLFVSLS